jgi:HPt (histidine-containing phosphotransfer) domain-containing protein
MAGKLNDYLAREASEYLDRIERLLDLGDDADPSELVRLARGVRGSARMAGSEAVSRAGEQLESIARSAAERPGAWSIGAMRDALAIASELRGLLAAVPIEKFFHDDDGPHILSGPGAGADAKPSTVIPAKAGIQSSGEPLPIEDLLFRGDAALRAAIALRSEIENAIGTASPDAPALLGELFDLMELARSG